MLASAFSVMSFARQPLDTLKMDELRRSPVLSVDEAIAGRIAGVNVSFADDAPGRQASYSFRGIDVSDPLFVMDGVIVDQAFVHGLNPAQVESIVVLTDIAATSRYGSEGLGGVVEITMKKGREGRPVVDFDAFWGANIFSRTSLSGTGYDAGAVAPALVQDYSVSVSGGSKAAGNRYFANLGFIGDGGVLKGTSDNRFQGNLRYEQNLAGKLTFHLGAAYRNDRRNGIATDVPYVDYTMVDGVPTPYDETDSYIMYHVLGQGADVVPTLENAFSKTVRADITGDAGIRWDIVKGLRLDVVALYNARTTDDQKFNGKKTIYGAQDSPYGMNINAAAVAGRQNRYSVEAVLSYKGEFSGGHGLDASASFLYGGESFGLRGERSCNMTTEALGTAAINTGTFIPVPIFDAAYSHMQAFARAAYSYMRRYEVYASFSADSFRSTAGGKWNLLPAAGVAWNFANEGFLKGSMLSSGRLSVSAGRAGSSIPVLNDGTVVFNGMVSTQADLSLSAGLWEDRLGAKLGAYWIAAGGNDFSGLEFSARGYPVRTDGIRLGVFANATACFGKSAGCFGGAGTVLETHGFDFAANVYWNPDCFRCADITAGYTVGRDILKVCGMRVFVNAGNLCHNRIYKGVDLAAEKAVKAPGRLGVTGGVSVCF